MRLRSRMAVIAAAVVAGMVVVGAAAQAQPQASVVDARLLTIRDEATRNMVRAYVEAAYQRGTPVEPLLAMAQQGVMFKASRKRIEKEMVKLEKNLRRSHDLLGGRATVDEVVAGADALATGVPEKAVVEVRQAAPRRSITVELGVLTELVAKGVPPMKAAEQVRELMARGATAAQLTELNAAVQQDVALGVSPSAALTLRGRGVMSLLPPPISVNAAQPSASPIRP